MFVNELRNFFSWAGGTVILKGDGSRWNGRQVENLIPKPPQPRSSDLNILPDGELNPQLSPLLSSSFPL